MPSSIADVNCGDNLPTPESISATDMCSEVTILQTIDPFIVDQCGGYAITYRWTATDDCGNSIETTQTFNVLPDAEDPRLDRAPAEIADISCNDAFPIQEDIGANDACGTATVVMSVDPFTEDQCSGYEVTYRWTLTDACDNTSEITRSFNVLPDSEGPMFDAQPGTIADISCNDILPTQEVLTASDPCGTAGVLASVDPFTEDQCGGYTITYRWTATDACGNTTEISQSFNVLPDSESPVFDSQPAAIANVSCQDGLPVQETLTATDACGTTSVTPSVDIFTEDNCGGYVITYRWVASDACGNTTETTQSFNVLPDTEIPVFDAQPAVIADVNCDDALPVQEVLTASDACASVNVVASVDPFVENQCGGYAITYCWTATDDCGNVIEETQTFNVLADSEGPVFDAQPSTIGDVNCQDVLPLQETLTATDACGTTNVVASVDPFVCLLYTSPSPRDLSTSRMPSSA